jgi:hypothetical protein
MGWDGRDGMTSCPSKLNPKSFEEEYEIDGLGLLEFHPSCVHPFIFHSFILETLPPPKKKKTRVLGFGQVQNFGGGRREEEEEEEEAEAEEKTKKT